MKIRNTFIIFLVSGFWHGANWTFIAWGFLNALFIMPSIIFNTNRTNLDIVAQGKYFPSIKDLFSIIVTFSLTVFAWIFFRSASLAHAFSIVSEIFSASLLSVPKFVGMGKALITLVLVAIFILIEWQGREGQYAISSLGLKWKKPLRFAFYYALIIGIFWFAGSEQEFIYFQF